MADRADSTNTILLGSSRVYRTFNPEILDSITHGKYQLDVHSYNLGSSAVSFLEVMYTIRETDLLESDNIKLVIVELANIVHTSEENAHTARNNFMMDSEWADEHWSWITDPSFPPDAQVRLIRQAVTAFFEDALHIGYVKDVAFFARKMKNRHKRRATKGYNPLVVKEPGQLPPFLKRRRTELLADTNRIARVAAETDSVLQLDNSDFTNTAFTEFCLSQIDKFDQHGKQLVFLIPPRSSYSQRILAVYDALPPDHRLNMTNLRQLGPLASWHYWFDRGHLNRDGAEYISRILADSIGNNYAPIFRGRQ